MCHFRKITHFCRKENNLKKTTTMFEKLFEVEGNADELLYIDDANGLKTTRFFHMGLDAMDESSEIIDVQVTSTNPMGETPIFDRMMGKNVRIVVEVENE